MKLLWHFLLPQALMRPACGQGNRLPPSVWSDESSALFDSVIVRKTPSATAMRGPTLLNFSELGAPPQKGGSFLSCEDLWAVVCVITLLLMLIRTDCPVEGWAESCCVAAFSHIQSWTTALWAGSLILHRFKLSRKSLRNPFKLAVRPTDSIYNGNSAASTDARYSTCKSQKGMHKILGNAAYNNYLVIYSFIQLFIYFYFIWKLIYEFRAHSQQPLWTAFRAQVYFLFLPFKFPL